MKNLAVALLASTSLLIAAPAFAWDIDAMNTQVDQTNVMVDKDCSGTIIGAGYILTANHCIADQFDIVTKEVEDKDHPGAIKDVKIKISKPGTVSQFVFNGPKPVGQSAIVYKVKAHDGEHDLALLQLQSNSPNATVAPLACAEPKRGETVWSVGNPDMLYSNVAKGTITSLQRDYRMIGIDETGEADELNNQPGDNGLIQHDAPIAPGSSGGALYDDQGNLIGVNVRGTPIGAMYFAVPLDDIRKFLTDNGVTLPTCP